VDELLAKLDGSAGEVLKQEGQKPDDFEVPTWDRFSLLERRELSWGGADNCPTTERSNSTS